MLVQAYRAYAKIGSLIVGIARNFQFRRAATKVACVPDEKWRVAYATHPKIIMWA